VQELKTENDNEARVITEHKTGNDNLRGDVDELRGKVGAR
jgi:hypothetical protein